MKHKQVLSLEVRVDLGVIAMERHPTPTKSPELMQFSVIP